MQDQPANLVSERNSSTVRSLRIRALHSSSITIFIPQCFDNLWQVYDAVGLTPSHDWDMNNTCIGVGSSKGEWKEYDSYEGERNHRIDGESKARKQN